MSFLVWKRRFFSTVWPTVHTYPVKTVTENASFQKRFFKVEIPENGVFRIRWCHSSYTTSITHTLWGVLSCYSSTCGFFRKRRENLRFPKNYPDNCGRGLRIQHPAPLQTLELDISQAIHTWAQLFKGRLALNRGLNLTRVLFLFFKSIFFFVILRASHHQLVDKKN